MHSTLWQDREEPPTQAAKDGPLELSLDNAFDLIEGTLSCKFIIINQLTGLATRRHSN